MIVGSEMYGFVFSYETIIIMKRKHHRSVAIQIGKNSKVEK
jgi:hypothetical protein